MYRNTNIVSVAPIEKIIAVLSYLSCGFVGFIWLVIGVFMKKKIKPFLSFHIFQSIFLSLLFTIIHFLWSKISVILWIIPGINKIMGFFSVLFIKPIVFNLSIINLLMGLFVIYLCVGAIRGKLSYVPWVSNIVNFNIRR